MKPDFKPGKNIAVKVPDHEFDKTVFFYEHILGLECKRPEVTGGYESIVFEFGGKNLWIDKISGISQAEVWLEIETSSAEHAAQYLREQGCVIRKNIESLTKSLNGFWLSSPSNIIHLIVE